MGLTMAVCRRRFRGGDRRIGGHGTRCLKRSLPVADAEFYSPDADPAHRGQIPARPCRYADRNIYQVISDSYLRPDLHHASGGNLEVVGGVVG